MPTILFIHSAGPQTPGEGSSRLVAAIRAALPADIAFEAPLMPEPDNPHASRWLPVIARTIAQQTRPFVLAGHSLGASSVLQPLAAPRAPTNLKGVVLLATPFWSPDDLELAEYALPADAAERLAAIGPVTLLLGEDDDVIPRDHLERYRRLLPKADARLLPAVDHEAEGAASAVLEACLTWLG